MKTVELESDRMPAFCQLLNHVVLYDYIAINEICTRAFNYGLTAAIRVFLLAFTWSQNIDNMLAALPSVQLPDISLDRQALRDPYSDPGIPV